MRSLICGIFLELKWANFKFVYSKNEFSKLSDRRTYIHTYAPEIVTKKSMQIIQWLFLTFSWRPLKLYICTYIRMNIYTYVHAYIHAISNLNILQTSSLNVNV